MLLRSNLWQSFYDTLHFNAPIDLQGTVMFIGLSVTDNGFGVFNFTLPVTPCASAGGTVVAATVPSAVTKPVVSMAASASAKPYTPTFGKAKIARYWK